MIVIYYLVSILLLFQKFAVMHQQDENHVFQTKLLKSLSGQLSLEESDLLSRIIVKIIFFTLLE